MWLPGTGEFHVGRFNDESELYSKPEKMELYHASSVIERLEIDGVVFNGGVIHWFNLSSRNPERPYATLIEGYRDLDPAQRIYAEEYIDELFSREEIDILGAYLKKAPDDRLRLIEGDEGPLFVHRASLSDDSLRTGYRHMPSGGLAGRYQLSDQGTYDLDFKVEGYFDLTEEGYRDRMKESAMYVRRVLQILGIDAGVKLSQIEDAVVNIYERERLYVTAGSAARVLDNIEI